MTNQLIKIGGGEQLIENDYLNELFHHYRQCEVPQIKDLLHKAIVTIESLQQGYLPDELPTMEVPESIIEDIQAYVLGKFPTDQVAGNALWQRLTEPLEEIDYLLRHLRDELIDDFSMYAYVSSPFVRDLANFTNGEPVLEIMAGQGYISAGLRALNPNQTVWATDNEDWRDQPDATKSEPVTAINVMTAIAAIEKYGELVSTVIMSWAPDTTEDDLAVLDFIRANAYRFDFDFIVIGEQDGATNSRAFWSAAKLKKVPELNQHHQSFDLIDEQVFLVE
jgi:hypothetical protein